MGEFDDFIPSQRVAFWIWKILGIWATDDESPFYRAYRRIYHFFFTGIYLFSMFTSSFFTENSEELWVEILFILPTEIAMLTKTIITVYKFETIHRLLQTTISKEFQPTCPKHGKEYDRFFDRFSKVMLMYYFCSVCAAWTHLGFLFDDRLKLPFFNWFFWVPLDRDHLNNYYILFAYQMIGMMGHCSLNVSGDMNIAYLLSIAGQQLDLLSCKFASLLVPGTGTTIEKDYYKRTFVEQIQHFAREIERTVSWCVFAQICASGITICAIVFRLSAISIIDHLGTSIPMFFYMVSMLTQIFLPCYFGNDVTLKSQKLTNALYTSKWYQLAMNDRKDLKMMTLRTSESIRLKAGGFFNFNLEAFTSTLNTAYSVYAVLNSKNNK
ncbi:AAEL003395-PA [Aedes aegypti]|uniref:Odorant receptor n=2 Tax=Aedes aegypti TaxID=7159 RepID=Q17FM0_AEDAE|nr:AAEL003395-PA [Aedes aegypti]DAA80379.1 TPA_exp: odorant receptor 34 [Aedes aegypti]